LCDLRKESVLLLSLRSVGSIHSQGWVPIETWYVAISLMCSPPHLGSIHSQGWVPIETDEFYIGCGREIVSAVAFTPKGGCPLKPKHNGHKRRDGVLGR
jgi:hypothetical protein